MENVRTPFYNYFTIIKNKKKPKEIFYVIVNERTTGITYVGNGCSMQMKWRMSGLLQPQLPLVRPIHAAPFNPALITLGSGTGSASIAPIQHPAMRQILRARDMRFRPLPAEPLEAGDFYDYPEETKLESGEFPAKNPARSRSTEKERNSLRSELPVKYDHPAGHKGSHPGDDSNRGTKKARMGVRARRNRRKMTFANKEKLLQNADHDGQWKRGNIWNTLTSFKEGLDG